jgi:hypothetical protein
MIIKSNKNLGVESTLLPKKNLGVESALLPIKKMCLKMKKAKPDTKVASRATQERVYLIYQSSLKLKINVYHAKRVVIHI